MSLNERINVFINLEKHPHPPHLQTKVFLSMRLGGTGRNVRELRDVNASQNLKEISEMANKTVTRFTHPS